MWVRIQAIAIMPRKAKNSRRKAKKNGSKRDGSVGNKNGAEEVQGIVRSRLELIEKLGNSEFHLLPECLRRGTLGWKSVPISFFLRPSTHPPYASISIQSPLEARSRGSPSQEDFEEAC